MLVREVLTIGVDELSRTQWKRLFKAISYTIEGEVFEPWRHVPSRRIIKVPRGAWEYLPDDISYVDQRVCPEAPTHEFNITLDDKLADGRTFEGQKDALKAMVEQEQGIIHRPPGTGKTQIAEAFIASCATKVLVIVHTKDILNQWVEYTQRAIPTIQIGQLGAGVDTDGQVVIATVQSIVRLENMPEWVARFGAVILDECHHGPAQSFEHVLNVCPARYRFGFTATLSRADGHHPYMKTLLGPVISRQKFESKVPVHIEVVKTDFDFRFRGTYDWMPCLEAIEYDEDRNRLIVERVMEDVYHGKATLVLSRRLAHLGNIYMMISELYHPSWLGKIAILTGQVKDKERKQILKDFRSGKILCVLATQLADESLDIPVLSRVHLTFPGKHDGRIIQQVGRALREAPDKEDAVIYDYYDWRVGPLRRQFLKRREAYRKMKIKTKGLGGLRSRMHAR